MGLVFATISLMRFIYEYVKKTDLYSLGLEPLQNTVVIEKLAPLVVV